MRRVLIIAYYWPPSAGSGVQRWLKFAKYLPEFGWQPVIYTPKNPDFEIQDVSLLKEIPEQVEVLKKDIWEPYSLHRLFFGNKADKIKSAGVVTASKSSWKSYLSNWIRGNVFIPDPKIFWVKPSVKFLKTYLSRHPVDLIISTGTPHSMHLIAKRLKTDIKIPWIADFRDPMSKLDMLESYHISSRNFRKYQDLEQSVIKQADIVLTTSEVWRRDFDDLGANRSECITNGYDESDFAGEVEPYKKFVISHFGLLNHLRNPIQLWKALAELCEENSEFKDDLSIHVGGTIDQDVIEEIRAYNDLNKRLQMFDYLSHGKVIEEYLKSSVLLLLLFNSKSGTGNIPGKLFEYLAAKKPIIAFGKGDGDSKEIIIKTQSGSFFDYDEDNIKELKAQLLSTYRQFKEKHIREPIDAYNYSRFALTEKLVGYLNELI